MTMFGEPRLDTETFEARIKQPSPHLGKLTTVKQTTSQAMNYGLHAIGALDRKKVKNKIKK